MRNIHQQVNTEIGQAADTRKPLFEKLEQSLGNRTLVTFFTSFNYPADITDDDADMLQSVLQNIDCRQGLVLMISSPGGDGIAAERIVNICRAYSVHIPAQADHRFRRKPITIPRQADH